MKCDGNNDEQIAMNAWVGRVGEKKEKNYSAINVQGAYPKAKTLTKSLVTQSSESGNCRLSS